MAREDMFKMEYLKRVQSRNPFQGWAELRDGEAPKISDSREPLLSLLGRHKERGRLQEFGESAIDRSCGLERRGSSAKQRCSRK